MKKIFLFSFIILLVSGCATTNKIPEGSKIQSRVANQTPLSTILTWFETGDRPTQEQFEDAWANSYNSVSDGLWDLTGYPSIGFSPYSTMQVGKFSQVVGFPTDTTIKLNWNGTLAVSNLWVNGQKFNPAGGTSSGWTYNAGVLYQTDPVANVAIGGGTSVNGHDLYVTGSTYSTSRIGTQAYELFNSNGDYAVISMDGFGNMTFDDITTIAPIPLSSLGGAAAWQIHSKTVFPAWQKDTLIIGSGGLVYGQADSAITAWGTAMFRMPVYFDSTVYIDGSLTTSRELTAPSYAITGGGYSASIDITSGKLRFTDIDVPGGITLGSISSQFTKSGTNIKPLSLTDNLVIGSNLDFGGAGFDLAVNGVTWLGGGAVLAGSLSIGNGGKLSLGGSVEMKIGSSGIYSQLIFKDDIVGEKTLSELAGANQDSISVSYLNVDTTYFNGDYTKKMYSNLSNDIYFNISGAQFRFQEYALNSLHYSVSHSNTFQLSALVNDTMQTKYGFVQQGKMYLSKNDTIIKYATGKGNEWMKLATEKYVDGVFAGGLGSNITVDTLKVNYGGSYTGINVTANANGINLNKSGLVLGLSKGTDTYGVVSNLGTLQFATTNSDIMKGFVNDTTRFAADTAYAVSANWVREYVSENGGSGGISSPGGSPGNVQYNNAGNLGGFWSYNGTNLVPTTATGIAWATGSFIKGYSSGDSVSVGKSIAMTNSFTSETNQKQAFKSKFAYAGSYLNSLGSVYLNYADANANNGEVYGVYSNIFADENYAATGNTSYTSAGKFILQNLGTTTIGGGSPGSLIMSGISAEITGTINSDPTPGTYILSAIYGKNTNAGTAISYAGYFDGRVNVAGTLTVSQGFGLGGGTHTGGINTSDWSVSATGSLTGISGITNDAAITSTGGIVSLNASSNYAVNLATGTSTGAVSIGGGSNTVAVNSTNWDISTAGSVSGLTTVSMSGQLTSTLATGTSPFAVTSTTVNTNLNADLLDGQTGSYYQTATNITSGTLPGDRGITSGSSSSSFVEYNGTTRTAGQFYGGSTLATGTTVLNYDGYFRSTRNYSDYYYSNQLSSITDTMAAVWYPGGYLDSASLVIAANGWEIELEDFDTYYSEAERLKALPLPYPNGVERRRPNALYSNYQFEFELERLTRYFKQERDNNKVLLSRIEYLEKQSGIKVKKQRKNRR